MRIGRFIVICLAGLFLSSVAQAGLTEAFDENFTDATVCGAGSGSPGYVPGANWIIDHGVAKPDPTYQPWTASYTGICRLGYSGTGSVGYSNGTPNRLLTTADLGSGAYFMRGGYRAQMLFGYRDASNYYILNCTQMYYGNGVGNATMAVGKVVGGTTTWLRGVNGGITEVSTDIYEVSLNWDVDAQSISASLIIKDATGAQKTSLSLPAFTDSTYTSGRFGALQPNATIYNIDEISFTRLGHFYYFSAAGNDTTGNGSQANPWATIAKANTLNLDPGDSLLFRGGDSFSGSLYLSAEDAGTASRPVVIGSYGTGRATISAGTGGGIEVDNAGGIRIENLVVTGAGIGSNQLDGILFWNGLPSNTKLSYVRISNCDISGFGGASGNDGCGIWILGDASDGSQSGYTDVRITGCNCYSNGYYGIYLSGYWNPAATQYANSNVYVGDCTAHDNTGDYNYTTNHSGSGIMLSDVDGGTVERCVAYNNGAQCRSAAGGPFGIWAAVANNITIQNCESYNNHTQAKDGGGFDFDGGTTNSVLQYNYSHGNDGSGFLLYTYSGAPFSDTGNTVRFNISENDARKGTINGGIHVQNDGDGMSNIEVYHNTVYLTPNASGATAVAALISRKATDTRFRNNVAVTASGARLVDATASTGVRFENNLYWPSGSAFTLKYGSSSYTSLASWQTATGQERIGTQNVGMQADPKLINPGSGGTFNNGYSLAQLTAYRLRLDSPVRDQGLNLTQSPYSLSVGTRDFVGAALPQNDRFDMGAHEAVAGPLLAEDIGAPTYAGAASRAATGTWTVSGGGTDIGGTSDQFEFLHQKFTGDGILIVRVTAIQNTDTLARAGLMIRGSTAANAPFAQIAQLLNNEVRFEWRSTAGGTASASTRLGGATSVKWLKLVRAGNAFSAYYATTTGIPASADWVQAGTTQTLSNIPSTAEAGLAVTSHNSSAACTATLTDLAITGGGTNLISNPGLESGLSPWTTSGLAYLSSVGTHSGSGAAAFQAGGDGLYLNITGLTANTTYVFRGFTNSASGDVLYVRVRNYGGPDRDQVQATTGQYTQGFVTFTTGAINTSASLEIYKGSGTGLSFADDFELIVAQ